ncbi:FKBP-type peptidyl-prolyl cis-trans isomerase [Vibrio minamisatsumaniensis]|uniref:FKBP-type peptidyl-prolyl cis-trans isomerase n=1 Tax=Vibrio minamisatsumaniensis TaxID=2910243 RepID=UPI003D1D444B
MKLKMFLDFALEVIRVFKPEQRKWLVRTFVLAGISMISSPWWQPFIEALIEQKLDIDLSVASAPGWVLITIGLALHGFNVYQDKESKKEPVFKDEHDTLTFSLGGGVSCSYSKEQLKKPNAPFHLGGHLPIKVYVEKKKLYADVDVYSASGLPPIKISKNVLSGVPPTWDVNKSDKALEVVNANNQPIYQLVYKNDGHIIINGIFPFPGGLVLADDSHMSINPQEPATLELSPIFKYPSWKYPSVYNEDYAPKKSAPTPEFSNSARSRQEELQSRVHQARTEPTKWVESGDPVQSDSRVVIDFEGSIDSIPFEGGKAEKFTLQMGQGRMIAGFEDGIIGKKVGESFDVNLRFPSDYHAENLKGKSVVFHITIHKIENKLMATQCA